MSIKSILLIYGGEPREDGAAEAAFALARRFSGHVRALHLSPDAAAYAGVYGEALPGSLAFVDAIAQEAEARSARTRERFEMMAARFQAVVDSDRLPVHHPSASFRHRRGAIDRLVQAEARFADLIVVAKHAADEGMAGAAALNAALFGSAWPVLLVPEHMGGASLEHTVAVAWNGSQESAAALHASMPLLGSAEQVHIITVRRPKQPVDISDDTLLMRYLSLHGIAAVHTIVEKQDEEAGAMILAKAEEAKATLLVTGAYGHSRLREMVLGGVTEHVLKHAHLPVLLAR